MVRPAHNDQCRRNGLPKTKVQKVPGTKWNRFKVWNRRFMAPNVAAQGVRIRICVCVKSAPDSASRAPTQNLITWEMGC